MLPPAEEKVASPGCDVITMKHVSAEPQGIQLQYQLWPYDSLLFGKMYASTLSIPVLVSSGAAAVGCSQQGKLTNASEQRPNIFSILGYHLWQHHGCIPLEHCLDMPGSIRMPHKELATSSRLQNI